MKKLWIAAIALGTMASSFGQAVKIVDNSGGYYADSPYNRLYNPRTVTTFKGKVIGIQEVAPMRGMSGAMTYLVKASNGGTALVDVGPAWFVKNQEAKIKMGDTIQVTGSKIMIDGRGQILASQIVVGKRVLALRRAEGQPYWAAVTSSNNVTVSPNLNSMNGNVVRTDRYIYDGVPYRYMVLQQPGGNVFVDLGPEWFFERQNIVYNAGDYVQVIGAGRPYTVGNVTIVPSNTIYRGNDVLNLRYQNGNPVWQWNPPGMGGG